MDEWMCGWVDGCASERVREAGKREGAREVRGRVSTWE